VWHTTARIEFGDSSLNFIELPAFRLDEGGNRFGRKERLRAPRTLRERLEPLFASSVWCSGLKRSAQ